VDTALKEKQAQVQGHQRLQEERKKQYEQLYINEYLARQQQMERQKIELEEKRNWEHL
jgi:hypothetical protein